jgi:predicted lipoprotein with Yx(FWY)xxD motif
MKEETLMSGLTAKFALLGALAVIAAGALIPAGLAGSSKSSATMVRVHQSKLGRILVDGRGRTLYVFAKDARGTSKCYGACAVYWPPLIASGKVRATAGAKASLLATTMRRDGRRQVTYKGHPLYRFFQDTKAGQTNGEGLTDFGGEWDAVSPTGARVEKAGDPPPGY